MAMSLRKVTPDQRYMASLTKRPNYDEAREECIVAIGEELSDIL